jgi:hypothetical protein
LVTASSSLIGSEVYGLDKSQQAVFFSNAGETSWNERHLQKQLLVEPHEVARFIKAFLAGGGRADSKSVTSFLAGAVSMS